MTARKKICLILAILLGIALLVCAVLLIVTNARRTASYNGLTIPKDVYQYLQLHYKQEYITDHATEGAKDTEAFWNTEKEDGLTWGEDLDEEVRTYVKRVLVGASLFDEMGYTWTDQMTTTIENLANTLVKERFGGSKAAYNEAAKPYGFSYDSMLKSFMLEYKTSYVSTYATTSDTAVSDAFFSDYYIHIQLLYLPKSSESYEDDLTFLRSQLENGATTDQFTVWCNSSYNQNPGYDSFPDGYYFCATSDYTEDYISYLKEIVVAGFALDAVGDYQEVYVKNSTIGIDGTYFLMKYELEDDAYDSDSYSDMFSDFETLKNAHYLVTWVDYLTESVELYEEHLPACLVEDKNNPLYLFFQ